MNKMLSIYSKTNNCVNNDHIPVNSINKICLLYEEIAIHTQKLHIATIIIEALL